MKDPNSEVNGGNEVLLEEKKGVLRRAMLSARPDFDDFYGYRGFPDGMLKDDKERLKKRLAEDREKGNAKSNDEFAKNMEPLLTYILNDERLLPTRDSFSFLASVYDDKLNGTDVVFGVQDSKKDFFVTFGADAATGTDIDNISKKFDNSFSWHDGTSYIKYCLHDDRRWRDRQAPHFVLGMSPASENNAFGHILINNDQLIGREEDFDADFIILSEIHEEIFMCLDMLEGKKGENSLKRVEKLKRLIPAVNMGIRRVLSFNAKEYPDSTERQNALFKKYQEKIAEMKQYDAVYENIMGTTKEWRNEIKIGRIAEDNAQR
ncbi:hypothetical protein IKF92_00715 [Candidatus Saccharibacteria bacterium]|nr:hypothetical protein [Candidatus Saccharibacteria bacterium]